MCILFIKLIKSARPGVFKLILASNRDELFRRPSKTAHFWKEDATIFGGKDMTEGKEGGTWLALSKKGKLGVLLNLSGIPNPKKLGRGFLIHDYLKTSLTDEEYFRVLTEEKERYNSFHLVTAVLGPRPKLFHYSNKTDESEVTELDDAEVFAVGNSSMKKPFKKVVKGKSKFEEICKEFGKVETKNELIAALLSLLKREEKHYPDEVIDSLSHLPQNFKPNYSAIFVKGDDGTFGTRTHTIVLVDWNNTVEFREWTLLDPITPDHMVWNETFEEFKLETETNPAH